jgi:hypothetical protein
MTRRKQVEPKEVLDYQLAKMKKNYELMRDANRDLDKIDPALYHLYKKVTEAALGGLDLNDEVIYNKYMKLMDDFRKKTYDDYEKSAAATLMVDKKSHPFSVVGQTTPISKNFTNTFVDTGTKKEEVVE